VREQEFSAFLAQEEPRLRRVLISRYGSEVGREAAAEALAYAWEHWRKLAEMKNPAGYLFRVGQSRARKFRPRTRPLLKEPAAAGNPEPWVEPKLASSLARLSPQQRTAVLMIHGYENTYEETATALGVSRSTIQRHVERGMAKLRRDLEVRDD
jgi:DNA-directed RNA polymerase specialized sigma24 family protein